MKVCVQVRSFVSAIPSPFTSRPDGLSCAIVSRSSTFKRDALPEERVQADAERRPELHAADSQ